MRNHSRLNSQHVRFIVYSIDSQFARLHSESRTYWSLVAPLLVRSLEDSGVTDSLLQFCQKPDFQLPASLEEQLVIGNAFLNQESRSRVSSHYGLTTPPPRLIIPLDGTCDSSRRLTGHLQMTSGQNP